MKSEILTLEFEIKEYKELYTVKQIEVDSL